MIPTMMAETFASFFMSGGVIMKAHVARRVAITLDAFFRKKEKSQHSRFPYPKRKLDFFIPSTSE